MVLKITAGNSQKDYLYVTMGSNQTVCIAQRQKESAIGVKDLTFLTITPFIVKSTAEITAKHSPTMFCRPIFSLFRFKICSLLSTFSLNFSSELNDCAQKALNPSKWEIKGKRPKRSKFIFSLEFAIFCLPSSFRLYSDLFWPKIGTFDQI